MGCKSKFDSSFKSKIAIEAVKEQRVKLVDKRPDGLSKSRCCKMLEVSRGSQYYKPKGESQANIDIKKKMDKYSLDHPTSGARTMVSFLAMDGIVVNHKRISRLMKVMWLKCIYPQKSLPKGGRPSYHFPYLLRHLGQEK